MFSRAKELPSPDILYQQVVQALQLTEVDVAANRAGHLSPNQIAEFQGFVSKGQKTTLLFVPLMIVVVVVIAGLQMSNLTSDGQSIGDYLSDNPAILIGLGGTLVLYLVMAAFALLRASTLDVSRLPVKSIDGKVKLTKTTIRGMQGAMVKAAGASRTSYIISVGRKRVYSVNPAVEGALVKGALYRIYYVKMSNIMYFVSAEALRTA